MGSVFKRVKKTIKKVTKPISKVTKGIAKGIAKVAKSVMKGVAKLNKKLADAEKALKDKKKNESLDEQGVLSRRAGINVFGDRKLQLMTKNLRQTAFDLEKVAKKKDEQAFDDI